MYFSRPNLHIDCLRGWYFTIHTRITRYFSQILDTAPQNFHTYVIFNAEFDGLVHNMYFPLCVYNKNLKKLKYLVKPHESFPFGIWFIIMAFFGKNPFCNTVKIQIINFDCLKLFLKEFGCLFSPECFKPIYIKFCLWVLDFLDWKKSIHQKTILFQLFSDVVMENVSTGTSFCRCSALTTNEKY